MKKFAKRMLGFAGLSIIAAITAATAIAPSPAAFAESTSASVNLTSVFAPRLTLTPITSGSETTNPEYSFKALYENVLNATATLVNKDDHDKEIASATIWEENFNGVTGEKITKVNLDNYGGYGRFTFTVSGVNEYNVPISRSIYVAYKEASVPAKPGSPTIKPEIPKVEVVRATVDIYTENGTFIDTVNINNPKEVDHIDLSNLPDGTYTLKITSYDKDDNVLKIEYKTIIIKREYPDGSVKVKIGDPGEEIGYVIITLKNIDGDPTHAKSVRVEHPHPGDIVSIDVTDLPAGEYDVIIDYYGLGGDFLKREILDPIPISTDGHIPISVDGEVDVVDVIDIEIEGEGGEVVRRVKVDRTSGDIYVYGKGGGLIFTIPGGYKDGEFDIPLDGLDPGDYIAILVYKDANGKIIGSTKYKIAYDGSETIIVPDTGSFFQGLNMSKEESIVATVAAITVSVIAVGVVVKNKRSSRK